MADIRKFRQEINDHLDKLEKSSIDEIEDKVKCLEDNIEDGLTKIQAIKSMITSAYDKLASLSTNPSEVFVYVKMAEDAANVADIYIENGKLKSTVEDVEFQPDSAFLYSYYMKKP
jgi:DNA-directed RNA polymerase specialized sigma54-like protein